jgi:hypothetical protein
VSIWWRSSDVLYFRRYRRADLLLAYVSLHIGIFVTMTLLRTVRVDIALGFGLFAILSIIARRIVRYRAGSPLRPAGAS